MKENLKGERGREEMQAKTNSFRKITQNFLASIVI